VRSPSLTNVSRSKRDAQLATLGQAQSPGPYRQRNVAPLALRPARTDLLQPGETAPSCRDQLQGPLRRRHQAIGRTPAAPYDAPASARVTCLRSADAVAVAVLGPQPLAPPIQEDIAIGRRHERH
jgi:hypothetical protein